jgi:cellulose synthase/poly-beta-1,6-N-acetylglucosamine synthase-like glycosyltransferase
MAHVLGGFDRDAANYPGGSTRYRQPHMTPWYTLLIVGLAVAFYGYGGYPLLLIVVRRFRRQPPVATAKPAAWPRISITLPAYNAEKTLRPVLDGLVRLDYPPALRQILVVSDGSTDGTDVLVAEYAHLGVELLRHSPRIGKTELENFAMTALTGEIIVNTDASVALAPDAVWRLVAALADPGVGVSSGRDISVASVGATGSGGEAAYVGYEMWLRDLETDVEAIVGSSGCLYAVRAELHRRQLPGHLARDFSSALWARLNGVRAVSVRDAICFVPRAASMRVEFNRKVRTMTRGLETLFYHGRLLNPIKYGMFSVLLWSHKLIRWLVPWAVVACAVAIIPLAATVWWARAGVVALALGLGLAALGWWWPQQARVPRACSMAAYFVSGTMAGLLAWVRALRGNGAALWDPTPRAQS